MTRPGATSRAFTLRDMVFSLFGKKEPEKMRKTRKKALSPNGSSPLKAPFPLPNRLRRRPPTRAKPVEAPSEPANFASTNGRPLFSSLGYTDPKPVEHAGSHAVRVTVLATISQARLDNVLHSPAKVDESHSKSGSRLLSQISASYNAGAHRDIPPARTSERTSQCGGAQRHPREELRTSSTAYRSHRHAPAPPEVIMMWASIGTAKHYLPANLLHSSEKGRRTLLVGRYLSRCCD